MFDEMIELLTEDKWTKGALARDSNDRIVTCDSSDAVKWDLSGFIYNYYGFNIKSQIMKERLEYNLPPEYKNNLPKFNDNCTFEQIQEFLRNANGYKRIYKPWISSV